jgi:hypothetical protein
MGKLSTTSFLIMMMGYAFANGGPAATGIQRGSSGIDERDLESTSAQEAQTKRQSTQDKARENPRHGSFPGSFGNIDRPQEETAPEGPKEYENIKRDPYLKGKGPVDPGNTGPGSNEK